MLTITIQVNAPSGQAIGIKEDIAAYLEKFGDARVVSIVEKLPEQLRMDSPPQRGAGPAERTRQAVYATGNRWASRTSRPRTAERGIQMKVVPLSLCVRCGGSATRFEVAGASGRAFYVQHICRDGASVETKRWPTREQATCEWNQMQTVEEV